MLDIWCFTVHNQQRISSTRERANEHSENFSCCWGHAAHRERYRSGARFWLDCRWAGYARSHRRALPLGERCHWYAPLGMGEPKMNFDLEDHMILQVVFLYGEVFY